jgi:quercetin dioxygenase-like cupin family protein
MSTLVSAEKGVTFDLERIARELRSEGPYAREGHVARALLHAPDLRIVVIVLEAGRTISPHHANVTASIQTISGDIRLQLPDRAVDLTAGHVLVLGAGLPHDVHAVSDSTFLLTLGWPAGDGSAS